MQEPKIVPSAVGTVVVASCPKQMTIKAISDLRTHVTETQLPMVPLLLRFLGLADELVDLFFLIQSHDLIGGANSLECVLFGY
jgi:hypothetical protein